MFSWAGGLGCGLGHTLGAVDSSHTSLTRDISDIHRHVLGKGTFPGDAMDVADVISSQTQINRRLPETETLEAEVTHWKMLCPCSTQGPNTIDPETVWKLKSHIRDLQQKQMREMDKHQLEVAVLQNTHRQKLADLADRHRKQLTDYQRQVEDLQNQDAAGNGDRDLLEEREMDLRRLKQQLTQMQRLNDSLNNLASDLRAEKEKLVRQLQDATHQLEESVLRNNEDSLKNNIAVRALKIEKGRLVAKLCRAEKKLFEHKTEQSLREWSPADNGRSIKLGQEKDLEILHLQERIEQMDAEHQETKELLSFALEEQNQLTECLREQEEYIKELRERPELQEEFGQSTETFRSHDVLPASVEDKDMRLPSTTDQHPPVDQDPERLTQQSRAVPLVDPKVLEEIEELECEVFQLNRIKDDLEEEIQEQQKIIHNQQQGKRALLQSFQEQKEKVHRLQHRQEEMNTERAQLLAAKDEMIRNLQVTLEELRAQLPDKSPPIPREPCEDEEVRASQPLPRENPSEERDPSQAEIQRLVQGIKEQDPETKLLTEENVRLTAQVDRLSKEEIGKLTRIIQQKDVEIQGLSSRISEASHSRNRHVEQLQRQLQECALKSQQILAILNEKRREKSHLERDDHEMTHRLAAKEADLQRAQEENQKLPTRVESSGQEVCTERIRDLSHVIREKDLEVAALSQICQTLLRILQTPSPGHGVRGGRIDQFQQLLQERDTLTQRGKIMEEWKEQVLTTVQNLKREAPQLQTHLRQLQAWACPNSENVLKPQTASLDQIQTYRGHDINFHELEKELAQLQLRIGELCNAKDLLLGNLDVIFLQTSSDSRKAVKSDPVSEASQVIREEVEELRKSGRGKETRIRTLQEDQQRWIASGAATGEGEGKAREHGDADSHTEQPKEKPAVLQNSLRAQELRTQAKSEELLALQEKLCGQLSENELLRQAVTNLKERMADFEMDVCRLKEENAKIVERSREQEMETRALQETNRLLSVTRREEASQHAAMREKALALEQLLREKEEGETGELNRLVAAVRSTQEKAAACQRERDAVVLALTQKETETCALQKEVHQLRERELRLTQELERGRQLAAEAQDSRRREALASEDRVAQLREEVTVLQGKLVWSSAAMQKASHGARLQVESLREQLHVVTQQKEEAVLRLAASQEEGRHCDQTLASLKLELAEWMEKADALEGNLKSLQGRLHQTSADLEEKEDQLQEFKKQNEVQQEILEDTQRKLMTLVSQSEGMADKTLLRRLFVGAFQAADAERQEALSLMASTLGIREDQLRQLRSREPAGVPSGGTGGPGSTSAPNTPAKPNHQAVANRSFSDLFVQFLEAESHSAFPPPKPSARVVKPPDSGGRGKPPKKQGPSRRNATLASTPGKKEVKPRTTAVSLINPPGPQMDGSEHLLLNAVTDALPVYTPHILSPAQKVGKAAKDLSKK
ncbi:thyroid receptor-interacting protein 11-like [Mustela erminea]|uniref:thyroid receptor-interacting protein 11-like n=1 Tax=Mustela erminea TaxID=36723 RepID=UPI00138764F1|nr:thyroid receptor-interacting protein 11-like [Mustela erminea]XP_032182752.1 thyroid receptor-interacting protein 11-like [Mustela erminea]XP_032182753.1 thyroid receptor-interacting protein 11-like [Mustela erminea]XP_032182754.1 thyroid receptor-interacting protein 11-like [Mustela erminea]XP_032182755.1 thyroid receptor-interacting protein 11-like [Mustela erminea]XP_032182756.1 thyroid receptor-interacting protein 11-like [Mustela erminea]